MIEEYTLYVSIYIKFMASKPKKVILTQWDIFVGDETSVNKARECLL